MFDFFGNPYNYPMPTVDATKQQFLSVNIPALVLIPEETVPHVKYMLRANVFFQATP